MNTTTEASRKDNILGLLGHMPLDPERQMLQNFLFSQDIWPRYSTAPASSKVAYHHAWDGGLVDHCAEMTLLALSLRTAPPSLLFEDIIRKVSPTDIVLVGLLHDLNKIGDTTGAAYYVPNFLKNGSRSDKIPYESNDEAHTFALAAPVAHRATAQLQTLLNAYPDVWPEGDLSLSLVAAYAPALHAALSPDVKFAIRHHAGMYDRKARHLMCDKETPLQVLMHFADMLSSRAEKWARGGVD